MKNIFYIVLISFLSQCTLDTGAATYSKNITESKSIKAFIQEYDFDIKKIEHGGLELEIDEVWLEYYWIYENFLKHIEIGDERRLVVSVTYKNEDDYWNGESPFKIKENGITSLGSSNRGTYKYIIGMEEYSDNILLKFWDQEVKLSKK